MNSLLNKPKCRGAEPATPTSSNPSFTRHKCRALHDSDGSSTGNSPHIDYKDPDAKFKHYGNFFGGGYKWTSEWLKDVPRVRVRTAESRKMNEMLDLAVLNERLAGNLEPWEARAKLEYLKMRKQNWELAYEYITRAEVTATLAIIEEAFLKAEETLNSKNPDNISISEMKRKLVALQQQVGEAQERLQVTQARVEENIEHINALRAEATAMERAKAATTRPKSLKDPRQQTLELPALRKASAKVPSSSYITTEPVSSLRAPKQRRNMGLHSSMELEQPLKLFWYPAEFSSKLGKDILIPLELFGEPWVLFRDERGSPSCIRDQCAHRACPLSIGKVVDGQVECAYHGWQFRGDGECIKMPSTQQCRNVAVAALPCIEKDGFIWVWPGEEAPEKVPDFTLPPPGYQIHAEITVEVPVEHGLLIENLLDLAHAPFTHVSTFARGWPVPDFVKFHAHRVLSGSWDPYPIDMAFLPPCMTLSVIGLEQPGKIERGLRSSQCKRHLHQLHVCLPSKKGHTRLLYRMSLDFMPWLRSVPFIDKLWKSVAGQVLGEDLPLVIGQQDRLVRGGDTWSFPVSYDKLAVRYRRWRNAVAAGESSGATAASPASMSAGELFSEDEEALYEDTLFETCDVPATNRDDEIAYEAKSSRM
jgi:chlorophyllide a oxygenase